MSKRELQEVADILRARAGEWNEELSYWQLGYRTGLLKAAQLLEDFKNKPLNMHGDY